MWNYSMIIVVISVEDFLMPSFFFIFIMVSPSDIECAACHHYKSHPNKDPSYHSVHTPLLVVVGPEVALIPYQLPSPFVILNEVDLKS